MVTINRGHIKRALAKLGATSIHVSDTVGWRETAYFDMPGRTNLRIEALSFNWESRERPIDKLYARIQNTEEFWGDVEECIYCQERKRNGAEMEASKFHEELTRYHREAANMEHHRVQAYFAASEESRARSMTGFARHQALAQEHFRKLEVLHESVNTLDAEARATAKAEVHRLKGAI
jgi:hypothetical protein